jgi:ArsR family transcriptional regulator, arsenate/arsenite/antimonite-responsive transcriptional repressor
VLASATNLEDVRPLTKFFRALGDETRVRIVALLVHGELCVCHLEQALGLSQPNCSRQLSILRAAGIVESRREGTWVYYRIIDQEHESVTNVLDVLARTFGAERALRADHVRLKKACGPDACR